MNNTLKQSFILVTIGSVPAAILRWQIGQIFFVNIIGCFLLGFINSITISKRYKLIFGFGFCGSLTTFSGWSSQLFELIQQGFYKQFFFNSIFMVIIGVFAVAMGHLFAEKIVN